MFHFYFTGSNDTTKFPMRNSSSKDSEPSDANNMTVHFNETKQPQVGVGLEQGRDEFITLQCVSSTNLYILLHQDRRKAQTTHTPKAFYSLS